MIANCFSTGEDVRRHQSTNFLAVYFKLEESKMKIQDELKEIRMLWGSYWASRVLLTANNFGVFEYLKLPQTAENIASKIKTNLRATEILLDALAGLRLIKKSSNKYKNSSLANRFLMPDSPYYQGNIIKHLDTAWKNWSELDEVIKTGKPANKAQNHASFIKGMHDISKIKAENVIKLINLKGIKKALDLGGGPGTYSIEMAKKGVSVTLFDLPETIKIAQEIIKKSGVKSIKFKAGDFLSDDIGKGYDLIFISQVLHAFSEDDNIKILQKSAEALNQEGRIVIQEFYIDNNRANPVRSAIFSVNMLVNTEGGRCYCPKEIKGWFIKAGLRKFQETVFDDCLVSTAKF